MDTNPQPNFEDSAYYSDDMSETKHKLLKAIYVNWDGQQPFGKWFTDKITEQTGLSDTGGLRNVSDEDLVTALSGRQKVAAGF